MNLKSFLERLPASLRNSLAQDASKAWFIIHTHVCRHGQTDRYDSNLRDALKKVTGKWISEATLKKHLRKMELAGLLTSHQIKVKYTGVGKAFLPFGSLFINQDGPRPGVFVRYTLPGMRPSLTIS